MQKAHGLFPNDRSAALHYAQALLRQGEHSAAAAILAPLCETEKDATFLETHAEALIRSGHLDEAHAALDRMQSQGMGSVEKVFLLVGEYFRIAQENKAVDLLATTMKGMIAARRESEFAISVDQLAEAFPKSLRLAQFRAALYNDLNRETKFFEAIVRLFELSLESNQIPAACEAFEKLVEIDPYDSRNQARFDSLRGRASDDFLKRVKTRLSNVATHSSDGPGKEQQSAALQSVQPQQPLLESIESRQTLEDLLVQAEIFVQYSLQSKAIERLQRIAEMFPGEEDHNERLRGLFDAAHWWPEKGVAAIRRPASEPFALLEASNSLPAASPLFAPETLRDLAKISEINQNVFRQPSPRAMLSVAVNEVGNYLRVSRCLGVLGPVGQPPQMASEYCSAGLDVSSRDQVLGLIGQIEHATPDSLGGLPLEASAAPMLREIGLETALGVQLSDPETQLPAGMLIAGFSGPHEWKPNESYFLQSIGNQMLMCVHHMRLRTLVRTLAVADEKTGLLARGSYIDCLLQESQRARAQGIPLALALLQIDGGPDLLRSHGEGAFDRYMELLGENVHGIVRQSDLAIKYTSWALAIVSAGYAAFPARANVCREVAQGAACRQLRPPWDAGPPTSKRGCGGSDCASRIMYNEDIVTDLINRVENGLEQARRRGGNEIITLELAKT